MYGTVKIWEESVIIPTYEVGAPDANPMFLEKRVYQGSSGRVYPHAVIDKVYDEKIDKSYRMIFLENQYIQIQIMPEIGGRIYRALDLTNNYDFVYYNRVIKPALVGLAGPWISGGIEFNWPQHHRPNTFGNVEYELKENADGSKTAFVSEIDRMYGTKVTTGFTLHPDKSYIEISAQMYNRTDQPQTFLWWANPAVLVHDQTQSIFPPDVHAVFDHGKRDVSKFPIATGTYYKVDYSAGVDISRYKNIPVPTSYMAYHSDYDFVGGYDYKAEAGILHVADHNVSPGKKQWTWGSGDFGKAWDRNLTDEDGPYIELMTGVFTDNQPDFTWLQPYEEKSFKQYFMPYKKIGSVKNASINAMIGLEIDKNKAVVTVYATSEYKDAKVTVRDKKRTYLETQVDISPRDVFSQEVLIDEPWVTVCVSDRDGNKLVDYTNKPQQIERTPNRATAIDKPETLKNTEALYLAATHLEQYRHATRRPDEYYLEGLKRDMEDIRLNNGYGKLLIRRYDFEAAEKYFRQAIKTSIRHNPNPYDTEPYFNLGKALKLQNRLEEAFSAFYKSVWSFAWQAQGYFELAQIANSLGHVQRALELVDMSLNNQYRNYKARNLKSILLSKLGRKQEAEDFARETLEMDPMDFASRNQLGLYDQLDRLFGGNVHNYIALSIDYADCGEYREAINVLNRIKDKTDYPMVFYYLGYYYKMLGDDVKRDEYFVLAESKDAGLCFPNSCWDFRVLQMAVNRAKDYGKARYYLGNLLYDKLRHQKAIELWEQASELLHQFPTVRRNLALAYYNKCRDGKKALAMLEKAFELNQKDARVLYELDQLYKKLGYNFEKRLTVMEKHMELVKQRDDLYLEYITLTNNTKDHEKALKLIRERNFHPWEGGEGKVPAQYVTANVEMAKKLMRDGKYDQAIEYLESARIYPENIGEGKLQGAQENNIMYYLGAAKKAIGDAECAEECLKLAAEGLSEPTSAMYYNDQPPHMIYYQGLACQMLGNYDKAHSRFNKLIDFGETHLFIDQEIDYFAVSLPDFLVFEEDLNRKNKIHCYYMMALGHLGLGNQQKAREYFEKTLELDVNHQGALLETNQE